MQLLSFRPASSLNSSGQSAFRAVVHSSFVNITRKRRRKLWWETLPEEELLDLQIRELDLRIEGSWIEPSVRQLERDLEKRDLKFRPHLWFSHEWFTPGGVPGIALPFYLAHPRLIQLERAQMNEVEGGSKEECIKILRHECGHAFQHAYQLHRQAQWRRLFGPSSRKYPDCYTPNPASRRYVQHLRLYYAQSHPVEDFAETFAVWLQPRAAWRKRYAGWPALKKLEFVDELLANLAEKTPAIRSRRRIDPVSSIRTTLRAYYSDKRRRYRIGFPDIYDRDLKRLFVEDDPKRQRELASSFLRRNRGEINRLVADWTHDYRYALEQVLPDMIGRCRELKLRVDGSGDGVLVDFAIMLVVHTVDFHHSRRSSFAL